MALARERKVGFRMKIQRELEIGISKEIMTSVYFNFKRNNYFLKPPKQPESFGDTRESFKANFYSSW